jgi:hypothetical protein
MEPIEKPDKNAPVWGETKCTCFPERKSGEPPIEEKKTIDFDQIKKWMGEAVGMTNTNPEIMENPNVEGYINMQITTLKKSVCMVFRNSPKRFLPYLFPHEIEKYQCFRDYNTGISIVHPVVYHYENDNKYICAFPHFNPSYPITDNPLHKLTSSYPDGHYMFQEARSQLLKIIVIPFFTYNFLANDQLFLYFCKRVFKYRVECAYRAPVRYARFFMQLYEHLLFINKAWKNDHYDLINYKYEKIESIWLNKEQKVKEVVVMTRRLLNITVFPKDSFPLCTGDYYLVLIIKFLFYELVTREPLLNAILNAFMEFLNNI